MPVPAVPRRALATMKTTYAFAVLLLVPLSALVRGSRAQDDRAAKMDVFRLPDTSRPESYELRFVPRFDGVNSTFVGVANVTVTVTATVRVIVLNAKDLNVTDVTVRDVERGRAVNTTGLVYVDRNEQLEIHLEKAAVAHRRYLVSIAYRGKIRTDMSGLYLSSYEENNATKWLAVTQFEATSARKAFPCYDEPAYKATFNITVVKRKDQIALSNMPILETVHGVDTDEVKFQRTPPMSSYLAAIYVGEFVPNAKRSSLTVYGRKDYINQTGYVSDDGMKHIRALEDYTGVKYSLPKMDLLAIPEFKAGAMENWGMTTYRESFIYLHEESKALLKIRSSEVVQHEFAHQWFGNLVTCAWWDYTWLNEGFARYFQYFGTKTVKTAWPMEEMFVVDAHQVALAYDQTPRHPITASVRTPDEIGELFDTVTYSKAAAVLRMLRYAVTDELFKSALRSYLDDRRENVATPDDLYVAFDNVLLDNSYEFKNEMTVNQFMSNWTLQSGYPVLNITKNTNPNTFSVIQSRFSINGTAVNGTAQSWIVGLTFTTESAKNFSYARPDVWTNETSNLTVIAAPADTGWYLFNVKSSGFYRVNYDAANWMALIRQLDGAHADVHVLNRAQLIDDAFALARAGHVNYTVPLRLTKYLTKENDTVPWRTAIKGFAYLLERMPRDERGYADLKDHVARLAGTIYEKLELLVTSGNTEFSVLSAWDAIATWACRLDNSYCTTKALDYYRRWETGGRISADIKDAAFCVGVKHGSGTATFDRMFGVYTATASISEKLSAEYALGCSTDRRDLTRYIDHILDGPRGPIKENDYNSVVSAISATPLGLDVLYEFLSTNMNRTLNELSDGQGTVNHIYSVLASKVTKDRDIAKLRDLKDDPSLPAPVKSSFEQSFEKVNHNLLWFNAYSDDIGQWALQNRKEEEQERSTTEQGSTTIKPFTDVSRQSTWSPQVTTPNPSSASSNVHNGFIILQLTVFTWLVKTYIF